MTEEAVRIATANAFLFRCAGISDLALGYLKDSFKLASGAAALATPARGTGERFMDWLDAAQAAGIETAAHLALRRACLATPVDPPPLRDVVDFTPAVPGDDLAQAAAAASNLANAAHRGSNPDAAWAGYWYAQLLHGADRLSTFNLGVISFERKDWDRAARQFEAVLAREPHAQDALVGLHNVALQGDRMAQLAPHLETLLKSREKPAPAAPRLIDAAPIIALQGKNGADVGDLILSRGVAHIRAAAREEACAELLRRANAWFAAYPDRLSWAPLEADSFYHDPYVLLNPEMAAALRQIFGRQPELSVLDTYLRRVTPQEAATYIPFHQDVTALAVTGVNVWVPLTPCGVDAPGLELMAERTTRIFPTVTSSGDYNQTEIDEATVYAEFAPDLRFCPTPAVGDAVAFLGSTVHRSHVAPGMSQPRLSLEMRFY